MVRLQLGSRCRMYVGAVEETDESLNGKVAARAEKIEVDKDIDIDERRR